MLDNNLILLIAIGIVVFLIMNLNWIINLSMCI